MGCEPGGGDRRARPRHGAAALLAAGALALALVAGACSNVADEPVAGLVRDPQLQVADVELTEVSADGSTSAFSTTPAPGELKIVYFGYTNCPDVCPTTMVDIRNALRELEPEEAERIEVAFVTVDPDRDTGEVLDTYLGHFFDRYETVRPATEAELDAAEEAFAASSSVTTGEDGVVEVSHSGTTYVVDSSGTVQVEWAFGTESTTMAEDLRILLARAGETDQGART